ncbi:MAG TPA: hypothetical protein VGF67_24310 [Ktedonobacteraceae bacterium]
MIARTDHTLCPHGQHRCDQVHDYRPRVARTINLREYQGKWIVLKRRFRWQQWGRTISEPESAYGIGVGEPPGACAKPSESSVSRKQ